MFAWLGLVITIVIWAGLAVLIARSRNRSLTTISSHGSVSKGAAVFFAVLLTGGGLVFYWWLIGWYVPHLHLSLTFSVLLTIVVLYVVATGLNNGRAGLSKAVHSYTAQTMALLFIPLALLIINNPAVSMAARVICICLAVYMVHSYVITEVMKRFQPQHLFFQTSYIVAFQLLILASAYINF